MVRTTVPCVAVSSPEVNGKSRCCETVFFFKKKNCLECSVVEALCKTQERKTARNAGDRFVNGETTHTLPSSTVDRGDDTVVFETVDKETEDTDPPHEKSSDIEPEFHRKEPPTKFHELQLEIRPK